MFGAFFSRTLATGYSLSAAFFKRPRAQMPFQRAASRKKADLCLEILEKRELMATGITSWIDTAAGVLYVGGTTRSDHIQIKFANQQIQVLDRLLNETVPIKVTQGNQVTTVNAISRNLVPYYLIVSTSEGSNRVEVAENAANPAKPLAIYGGQGDDYLAGGSANDAIYGLGGTDTIFGGAGDDYLVACYGIAEELAPLSGEFIDGGAGDDTIIGGKGNDRLIGGAGRNQIDGRGGADTIVDTFVGADVITFDPADAVTNPFAQYLASASASVKYNLGAQTGPITLATDGIGRIQSFTNGALVWSPTHGAHAVYGAIYTRWMASGGIAGNGYPTAEAFEFGEPTKVITPGAPLVVVNNNPVLTRINGRAGDPYAERLRIEAARLAGYSSNGPTVSSFSQTSQEFERATIVVAPLGKTVASPIDVKNATAYEVTGDFRAAFQRMGGARGMLGAPLGGVLPGPFRNAQVQQFQGGAIYWSAATGARGVGREIDVKYAAANSQVDASGQNVRNLLGLPVMDEASLANGGRWARFQGGDIYWSRGTGGASVVYGAIRDKYLALGGASGFLGLPLTDELAPASGVGRFNHFQGGSICWTPSSGANVVGGAILTRWRALGGENSPLGLAISGEQSVLDDTYRVVRFQNGSIVWKKATNQSFVVLGNEITLKQPIITDGAALGGEVHVTIRRDGTVRFWGHVHDSGAEGYDFQIRTIIRGEGMNAPVLLQKSGYVGGTFTTGSRDFDWDETTRNDGVASYFDVLAITSRMDVYEKHEGSFTGPLQDIADAALRWAGGVALVTPAAGFVIFAGVELGSLISNGSLVPGGRIIDGVLWLAGPYGTLYALAAEGIAALGSRTRELSQDEYDWAQREVFAGTLPPRDRIVLTDSIGGDDRAFVFPRFDGKITVNMGPDAFNDPRKYQEETEEKKTGIIYGQKFIHELTHVWQVYHSRRLSWITDALVSQTFNSLIGSAYQYQPGKRFGEYNLEQQASIVEHWFQDGKKSTSPLYGYIEGNIRLGNPD